MITFTKYAICFVLCSLELMCSAQPGVRQPCCYPDRYQYQYQKTFRNEAGDTQESVGIVLNDNVAQQYVISFSLNRNNVQLGSTMMYDVGKREVYFYSDCSKSDLEDNEIPFYFGRCLPANATYAATSSIDAGTVAVNKWKFTSRDGSETEVMTTADKCMLRVFDTTDYKTNRQGVRVTNGGLSFKTSNVKEGIDGTSMEVFNRLRACSSKESGKLPK